jgi:multidrug efflux pump subunit AcrA (membrane-fusion protein)
VPSSGPEYRTAIAATGSVVQQASGVGTVGVVSEQSAAFQVAGTLEAVAVKVGDSVAAGQALATLDPADLDEAVQSAEEALAEAEDQLATDLEAQASGATSSQTATAANVSASQQAAIASAVYTTGSGQAGAASAVHTTGSGQAGAASAVHTTGSGQTGAASAVHTTGSAQAGAASAVHSTTGAVRTGQAQPAAVTSQATPDQADVTAAVAAVEAAQGELLATYDVVNGLLEAAAGQLEASQTACAIFLAAVFPVNAAAEAAPAEGGAADDGAAGDGAAGDGTAGDGAAGDGAAELAAIQQSLLECQAAIAATQSGQTELGAAQLSLLEKAAALNTAASELLAAVEATDPQPSPEPEPSPSPDQPPEPGGDGAGGDGAGGDGAGGDQSPTDQGRPDSSASGSQPSQNGSQGSLAGGTASGGAAGGNGATQVAVTAEQILSDQAQIELLEANLAIAVQSRQAATLTASISGTVLAVNAAAGDSVSAGQTVAVIDGGQGFTVTLTMTLSTVKELAIGNPAVFTAGSTDQELTGQVASIGVTNLSNTSVPSFAVVLSVDQTDATLFDGAAVTAIITVAESGDVVTVPTSAVHVSSDGVSVQMLQDSELTDVPVSAGAMGAELTEITNGLAVGDAVVLADLSKDVISETSSSSSGFSPGGGMAGGGMAGGGGSLSFNVVPERGGAPMMP